MVLEQIEQLVQGTGSPLEKIGEFHAKADPLA